MDDATRALIGRCLDIVGQVLAMISDGDLILSPDPDPGQPWDYSRPGVTPMPRDDAGAVYDAGTGQPVTGRKLRDIEGDIWLKVDDDQYVIVMWHDGIRSEGESVESWQHVTRFAPLTLLPLTDEEREQELLYGPIGSRWGDPNTPCPYPHCALGIRHANAHKDREGRLLGQTERPPDGAPITRAAPTAGDLEPCTCHHPGAHLPTCPRYARLTGEPQ